VITHWACPLSSILSFKIYFSGV